MFVSQCFGKITKIGSARPSFSALLALLLACSSFMKAQEISAPPLSASTLSAPSLSSNTFSASLPDAPRVSTTTATTSDNLQSLPGTTLAGSDVFPTAHQRARRFLFDLLGPAAFIAPAFQSGVDQARSLKVGYPPDGFAAPGEHPAHGDIPEWGEGADGYAKRYASRFGQGLVGTTSRYAIGEILHEDVSYHRCHCSGILPRTEHALVQAYVAHSRSGRALPSVSALVSPFIASEVAVTAWYPARYNTSDALRTSVVSYIALPLNNVFSEFFGK